MPPNPPSNAHGFAMRSMSLRDMQIPKSEKKNSWPPPLPNPGDAPGCNLKHIKAPTRLGSDLHEDYRKSDSDKFNHEYRAAII